MGCRLQTGAAGPHLLQARPGGGEVLIYPPTNYFLRNHINSSSAAPFGSPPTTPLDKYTTRRLGRGCSQSDIWRSLWYQVQCSPWPDAQRPRPNSLLRSSSPTAYDSCLICAIFYTFVLRRGIFGGWFTPAIHVYQ